ncbi:MAG: hypothetical protein HQL06_10085 [Nitrospirae bacterium]|nr:hypothetical protein [Nitrospirota bacterium]MBF0344564.1 hypothetical protein [Nitrospirota bacterium]
MALPIKDTPVLTGKDAERFWKRAAESEAGLHKISDEERAQIIENAKKLEKIAKFPV